MKDVEYYRDYRNFLKFLEEIECYTIDPIEIFKEVSRFVSETFSEGFVDVKTRIWFNHDLLSKTLLMYTVHIGKEEGGTILHTANGIAMTGGIVFYTTNGIAITVYVPRGSKKVVMSISKWMP
jgi:hypothetical protein